MDFLRELKMPNLVYGLMILLTISLFFFSGRNDNVYNAITQQKNDTHNALEGIIHENNEKNIIKIDLTKGGITPQLIDDMIRREENERHICIAENRERHKQIMHNIESIFMVIFIAILTSLYLYSSYSLKKDDKNKTKQSENYTSDDEYEEDENHINAYHLLSTMEI